MTQRIIRLLMVSWIGASTAYDPYPYNPIIHNMGNHGWRGRIHAEFAPIFTRVTDRLVYGKNLRQHVLDTEAAGKRVLDLGCGVGFSTSAGEGSLGLDTSADMVAKGRRLFPEKEFAVGHSEHWEPDRDFDVVTCFFTFHETPRLARHTILERAKRIAKEKVIVVDISPDYCPNHAMLAGEPYLLEYLKHIESDMSASKERCLMPHHVQMWVLDVTPSLIHACPRCD